MADTKKKLLDIGNLSFNYPFSVAGKSDIEVTIDPLYAMEHIRTYMPELEQQSPETPGQIAELVKEGTEISEGFKELAGRTDFSVLEAIVFRLTAGLKYPIEYAPPMRDFYAVLRDAMAAPSGTQAIEVLGAFLACLKQIGETAALKKNGLESQSSPASTPAVSSSTTLGTKDQEVCGSTLNPSGPAKT